MSTIHDESFSVGSWVKVTVRFRIIFVDLGYKITKKLRIFMELYLD